MKDLPLIPMETVPLAYEQELWRSGISRIAGVDEVGRGALAGPVVAAAVVFSPDAKPIAGVKDSKLLSPEKRTFLALEIRRHAQSIGIGQVEAPQIDEINILQATRQAMVMALAQLDPPAELALVDGNQSIPLSVPQRLIIKGDQRVYSIAAASIVAKVLRDEWMKSLALTYPAFGFDQHKGYGTQVHREALAKHGPSPLHRRSFLKRMELAS